MTRIQLFYSRAYPGNTLRANTLQALAHLGVNPEMQVEETVPEQTGTPLPALAIDGEIVVYGVEPSVHELELLLQDRVQEREADFPAVDSGEAEASRAEAAASAEAAPRAAGERRHRNTS